MRVLHARAVQDRSTGSIDLDAVGGMPHERIASGGHCGLVLAGTALFQQFLFQNSLLFVPALFRRLDRLLLSVRPMYVQAEAGESHNQCKQSG